MKDDRTLDEIYIHLQNELIIKRDLTHDRATSKEMIERANVILEYNLKDLKELYEKKHPLKK